ncbi:MAG: hypothetical protein Q4A17_05770 [Thermoguttaceae bacterium]|nr:hypothetical protein [Thermoguttaceae bacterium]
MGSSKDIDRVHGGFHIQKYVSKETIAGIKVIQKKDVYKTGRSEDAPAHSNTSTAYFSINGETGRVLSLKIYENRDSVMEFHMHETGERNKEGTVHYHIYRKNKDGKIERDDKERRLTPELELKYGPLMQAAYERNISLGLGGNPPNYDFIEKDK